VRLAAPVAAASLVWVTSSLACIGDPPQAQLTEPQRRALARYQPKTAPRGVIGTEARFGGRVSLVGYTIEPRDLTQRIGDEIRVTFVWRVDRALDEGWRSFTDLVGKDGRVIAKLDNHGPLRAMAGVSGVPLPPSRWPTALVLDPVTFTLPPNAPANVELQIGFRRNQQRLAASGRATRNNAARLRLQVTASDNAKVPELTVPRRAGRVRIDGKLDETAWSHAAETGRFVNVGTGLLDERQPVQGRALMLWDDDHVYVAFDVWDRTVRGGFDPAAVDPHLWTRDTVEIMIDPDGDGDNRDYYEIQINPQNLIFDSRFDGYNRPRVSPSGPFGHQSWRAHVDSAVTIDGSIDDPRDIDRGYVVEARIPWSSFAKAERSPPKPGDRWRMNLYAMQNNGGVAWSPILGEGNFHRASRFGRVTWAP